MVQETNIVALSHLVVVTARTILPRRAAQQIKLFSSMDSVQSKLSTLTYKERIATDRFTFTVRDNYLYDLSQGS